MLHKHKDFVDAVFKNLKCDVFIVMKFKLNKYTIFSIDKIIENEPNFYNYTFENGMLNVNFKFPNDLTKLTFMNSNGDVMFSEYDLKNSLNFFVA